MRNHISQQVPDDVVSAMLRKARSDVASDLPLIADSVSKARKGPIKLLEEHYDVQVNGALKKEEPAIRESIMTTCKVLADDLATLEQLRTDLQVHPRSTAFDHLPWETSHGTTGHEATSTTDDLSPRSQTDRPKRTREPSPNDDTARNVKRRLSFD